MRRSVARGCVLLSLTLAHLAQAEVCPRMCDGHGICDTANRKCICFDGYMGGDCSLLICPKAIAWVDEAVATDTAHEMMECSNRGICKRLAGISATGCECAEGFEGAACERMSCPSNCNGHGACQSMSYFASLKDPGEGTVYPYTAVWDSEKIYGCVCSEGYSGPDCSVRLCPTGDDPLTGTVADVAMQYNEQQLVTCKADGGTFTLAFRNAHTQPIAYDADVETLQAALEAIPSIFSDYNVATSVAFEGDVACAKNGNEITVQFLQNFGTNLPLLVGDGGSLSLSISTSSVELAVARIRRGSKEDEVNPTRTPPSSPTRARNSQSGHLQPRFASRRRRRRRRRRRATAHSVKYRVCSCAPPRRVLLEPRSLCAGHGHLRVWHRLRHVRRLRRRGAAWRLWLGYGDRQRLPRRGFVLGSRCLRRNADVPLRLFGRMVWLRLLGDDVPVWN